MATKKTAGRTPALDAKVADKLLDKLGTDNDFRRLFKKDPAAALVKVGHPKDAAALTGQCCQIQNIAPKSEIQAARDQIKAHLTSTAAQTIIFCFESGKVAQSLRRK